MTRTRHESPLLGGGGGGSGGGARAVSAVSRRFASAAIVAVLALESLAAPALADDSPTRTVEQLADKAYQQHASGDYAASIATYLQAYEINKASEILFNVATIYDRKLHESELAIDYYRRYILHPDASPDLVKRATERLTVLKREHEEAEAKHAPATTAVAPAPSGPPASHSDRPDSGWRTAGIVVGATGIAGIFASLALGAAARAKNNAANSECAGLSCAGEKGVSDARDAGNLATASTVFMVAGGAVLLGGVVLVLAAPRTPASSVGTTLSVGPQSGARGPSGAGLSLSGSF